MTNKTTMMAKVYHCGEYRIVKDMAHGGTYALYHKWSENGHRKSKLINRYPSLSSALSMVVRSLEYCGL